jgi:hypothetical protein
MGASVQPGLRRIKALGRSALPKPLTVPVAAAEVIASGASGRGDPVRINVETPGVFPDPSKDCLGVFHALQDLRIVPGLHAIVGCDGDHATFPEMPGLILELGRRTGSPTPAEDEHDRGLRRTLVVRPSSSSPKRYAR